MTPDVANSSTEVHPPDRRHVRRKRERPDRRKVNVLQRDQLAFDDRRVPRWRGLARVARPGVEIHQQRAHDPALLGEVHVVLERLDERLLRSAGSGRRKSAVPARKYRRDVGASGTSLPPVVGGVCQRTGPRPVIAGRERVEDLRHDAGGRRLRQQTIVGEGREIDRAQHRQHGVAGLLRHREAVIEAADAGAGRRDHQAVEHRPAALVRVEAVADELAQAGGRSANSRSR